MYYTIKDYDEVTDEHLLEETQTVRIRRVDLLVTGELHETDNIKTLQNKIDFCKSLIGRTVYVKELTPISYVGDGIKILEHNEGMKAEPFIATVFKEIGVCFSLK